VTTPEEAAVLDVTTTQSRPVVSAAMATPPVVNAGDSKRSHARRASAEVRRLLLEAARSLFVAKGYAGASTREIALSAGVSEALLFRHFGSKANLFQRAILDPMSEFIHRYVDHWSSRPSADHTPEGLARTFLDGFYRFLSENRELVMALVTAQAYESIQEVNNAAPMSLILDELEQVASREAALRGYQFDVQISTRLVAGMAMAMAVLDEWLFPAGKGRPSHERIVDEMVAFALHGLSRQHPATMTSRTGD
jgi:AcrR family transcriptional regulator